MSTGFRPILPDGIQVPGTDNLNATKWSFLLVDVSFAGRTTSSQAKPLEAFAGLNVVTEALISEAPKRMASRRPSRPKVLLPVARVRLRLIPVAGVTKVVTEVGSTLPLCEAVAAPKRTSPLTVIRTG